MIIHELENGHHRLVSDTEQGEWASYEEVARLGEYGAVTNHHSHNLPPVFRVEELKEDEYKSHYFDLNSDGYWNKSLPSNMPTIPADLTHEEKGLQQTTEDAEKEPAKPNGEA